MTSEGASRNLGRTNAHEHALINLVIPRAWDFSINRCGLRPENTQEHLSTRLAEGLGRPFCFWGELRSRQSCRLGSLPTQANSGLEWGTQSGCGCVESRVFSFIGVLLRFRSHPPRLYVMKTIHDGVPTPVYCPVNRNWPVLRSTRNEVMASLRWLHAYRKAPPGAICMCLG
jgi:hypothetical protein